MNKDNIYFFQIQNIIDNKIFLPTATGYLWSYLAQSEKFLDSYILKDCFFVREDIDFVLSKINEPKIVCISTYVWNYEYSKRIAFNLKLKFPECLIVAGGPHIPYRLNFKESLPFFDLIVTYEGEEALLNICLERLKENPNYESIPGVITQNSKQFSKTKRIQSLSNLISPCLNGFYDSLIAKNPKLQFNLVIETNRGCPYSCTFCDMQDSFYQKLTLFELERIKNEISWAAKNKIEYIDCADSNFGIFKRDIEIVKFICSTKKKYGYPKMFNYTSAKNQPEHVKVIQKELGKVGIDRGISVSLQSLNSDVQESIKRYNLSDKRLEDIIHIYKKENLEFFIELIIGLPNESKRTWFYGLKKILNFDHHLSILSHPLSIVPNTPFTNLDYIKKHSLKYTKTRSPAQGFNYGTESSEERELICFENATMSKEDWIDSYIYTKSFVGALYSHGLIYYFLKFLKNKYLIDPGDFLELVFQHSKNQENMIGNEYRNAKKNLEDNLFQLKPWGRVVMSDGFYWSDQAASAIVFLRDIENLYRYIIDITKTHFPQVDLFLSEEVLKYNYYSLENPYQEKDSTNIEFNYNWKEIFQKNLKINKNKTFYKFKGTPWKDPRDHALHVYWYGRKSIRCFKKVVEV